MDILISEEVNSPFVTALARKYHLVCAGSLWKQRAALKQQIREARAIMVRNQTQVNAQLLAAATRLEVVGRIGVGLDNIDLKAATDRGVVVVAPLDANAISVAELTIGLTIALARKLPLADHSTKSGKWDRKRCMGVELSGKTLGICGFGRIGRLVGRSARALGMNLAVYDPYIKSDSPALTELNALAHKNLADALALADFVTVHMPLTPGTKRLFNARTFAAMKRGSFFINTSRGGIMDERALLACLRKDHLAGAALDVRATEPPGKSAFDQMDNVILTPHIGSFTVEAQSRTFQAVCDDVDRVLQGTPALNFVNLPLPKRPE